MPSFYHLKYHLFYLNLNAAFFITKIFYKKRILNSPRISRKLSLRKHYELRAIDYHGGAAIQHQQSAAACLQASQIRFNDTLYINAIFLHVASRI